MNFNHEVMTAVILQARLDSSRLPEKALLPLGGKPVILRVMEALNKVPADLRILACPEDSETAFAPLAREAGFTVFTGPKDDVLTRYCMAVERFGIRRVIRATGDNPFVFADAAAVINAEALVLGADYAAYGGLPFGAGVESVSAAALFRAGAEAAEQFEREHVCPYLYARPEKFLLHRPLAPRHFQSPKFRLTIDTLEDYERAQALYAVLDRLEKPGGVPDAKAVAARYCSAAIINAYSKAFPEADVLI